MTLSKETAFRLAVAVTVPFPPTLPSFGVIPASAIADDMIEKRACPGGYVALTFDGLNAETTLAITRELRAGHQARETFFMLGILAAEHPDTVMQARVEGMVVATTPLIVFFWTNLMRIMYETSWPQPAESSQGPPAQHRPASVRLTVERMTLLAIAQELDMAEVVWTLRLDDYAPAAVPQILDQAAKAKDDDILFFHDGYQTTVDAILRILGNVSSRGICSSRVVPTTVRRQVWLDYTGDDRTYYYYYAVATRW